jgi:hypothetical protein
MRFKKVAILVLGVMLLVLIVSPGSQPTLRGYFSGEARYGGRPTSYWSWRINNIPAKDIHFEEGCMGRAYSVVPATFVDTLKLKLGMGRPSFVEVQLPLSNGDPDTIPVLIELLKDPNLIIRQHAAHTLGLFEDRAACAEPALKECLVRPELDPGFNLASEVARALLRIHLKEETKEQND